MPVGGYGIDINVTFEIINNNEKRIWRKNYSESKTIRYGFYTKFGDNWIANNSLELFRLILKNFNDDISKDILRVKDELENSEPIDSSRKTIVSSESWLSNGSGIFISPSGYIVTNYHVVEGANDIEVEFILNEETQKFSAEVIQNDKVNDLSIIKINDSGFDRLDNIKYNFKARSSDVGTKVYAYGYPMALSVMGKEVKVTDGIISSKTGFGGDITTYQITAPIQGGNSGGPLFDEKGNLIGINSSGIRKDIADNVGYTIKSNYILNLIDVLPNNIDVPSTNELENLPLTEQIKEISKYVVLVKVK